MGPLNHPDLENGVGYYFTQAVPWVTDVSSFRRQPQIMNKQSFSLGACWSLFLKAFIEPQILRQAMAALWPTPLRINVQLLL